MDSLQARLGSRAAVAWAKSAPYAGEVEHWLPLWQHLDDAADIAGMLWDEWVAPSAKRLVEEAVGVDRARVLAVWLAGVHDIGKASPAFAVQVPRLSDRMRTAGLAFGTMVVQNRSQLRHEIAGAAALDRWLSARIPALDKFERRQLTVVVAGHHGVFPMLRAVFDAPGQDSLFGDADWIAVQDLMLDRAASRAGVDRDSPGWAGLELPQAAQLLLSGLVVMADWIASDERYFDLLDVEDVPPFPSAAPGPSRRARAAWRQVNVTPQWVPALDGELDARFLDRFPGVMERPRPVQTAVVQQAESMVAPGLLMLEAPMGVGKTEAAFMAAEVLAARCGATGCLVALPTQATSNAMFSRMLHWLERLPDGDAIGTQSVALVHGKAALNEDFRRLPFAGGGSVRLHDGVMDADGPVGRYTAVVSEWMRGRKRAALSSFVVSTIDQVLFAALRARHTMLRHLSLTGKVVIIDEVHAADVFMSVFLDRSLEWLAAAGVPVVLMSATLPAGRRTELYLAYERGRLRRQGQEVDELALPVLVRDQLGGDIGYPAIVTTGPDTPTVRVAADDSGSRQVRLERLDDDVPSLVALLKDRLHDGGCAVVIRNTVRRAQETAHALAAEFGENDITVAHAGFLAIDRSKLDGRLVELFGKPGGSAARPPRHVVVATQVVEQSLDVDFDLLVTDVAPVDLVLQRIGRLHRHDRGDERPTALQEATCFVTGVDWSSAVPTFDGGARAVYGHWPLLASLSVLAEHLAGPPLRLPGDIPRLVQAAYAESVSVPPTWQDTVDRARARYGEQQASRQHAARSGALSPVQERGESLYGQGRGSVGVIDEDSPDAVAYVRDGGDSVEVVVVQHGADGQDRVPDWIGSGGGERLPLRDYEVSPEQARALARCTLRLPYHFTNPGDIDAVIAELERQPFEGWRATPHLSGQLALVLDDDRTTTLAGHRLRYDTRYGLEVTKPDE